MLAKTYAPALFGLDGSIRSVRGTLLVAELAAILGFKRIVEAKDAAPEASLITGLEVWGITKFDEFFWSTSRRI